MKTLPWFVMMTLPSVAFSQEPIHFKDNVTVITTSVLQQTGVPSASVAVVKDGAIAYVNAYGQARLTPLEATQPAMRYAVGSISKQFTAAAILLLVQDGKLSLNDSVAKYFPGLTRANEITVRMLLSHTSGYSDYWPEDYVMTDMLLPTTPDAILNKWAKRPLDFDPGTKWEYSNTNYVLAGQIVEKVAGQPLVALLTQRVFQPLGMKSVYDVNQAKLPETDATGYYRHALGPLRPAPKEGVGWLSAAGELSMTAEDLARWDISLMNRSLLHAESYDEMFRDVKLKDGKATGYGLGVSVSVRDGHTFIEHSGEVSGFVSENIVVPDSQIAIVVLTNQDAVSAAGVIGQDIAQSMIARAPEEARAFSILTRLQHGQIDRSQFTNFCNGYFTSEALSDFETSLKPLGTPLGLSKQQEWHRGGMIFRSFRVQFKTRSLDLTTYEMPDGKLEQFLIVTRN